MSLELRDFHSNSVYDSTLSSDKCEMRVSRVCHIQDTLFWGSSRNDCFRVRQDLTGSQGTLMILMLHRPLDHFVRIVCIFAVRMKQMSLFIR